MLFLNLTWHDTIFFRCFFHRRRLTFSLISIALFRFMLMRLCTTQYHDIGNKINKQKQSRRHGKVITLAFFSIHNISVKLTHDVCPSRQTNDEIWHVCAQLALETLKVICRKRRATAQWSLDWQLQCEQFSKGSQSFHRYDNRKK